jgi:hypothetical protein
VYELLLLEYGTWALPFPFMVLFTLLQLPWRHDAFHTTASNFQSMCRLLAQKAWETNPAPLQRDPSLSQACRPSPQRLPSAPTALCTPCPPWRVYLVAATHRVEAAAKLTCLPA